MEAQRGKGQQDHVDAKKPMATQINWGKLLGDDLNEMMKEKVEK